MLDPEQIEIARNMREKHKSSWEMIAERFGVTVYYLRGCLDPHWKAYRLENTKRHRTRARARKENPTESYMTHHIVLQVDCPNDLLVERDRRLSLAPRDYTAKFFGDPLPGYSALDKKQRAFG